MERLLRSRVLLRLLNVGIRGGTVLGRFALIMFLAKFLPKAELGKFGVFVATVLICVLVASFDFNKYMYREYIANDVDVRPKILGSHLKVIGALYLLSVPLLYFIFSSGLIASDYVFHFYALLFLVLVSLELERFLVLLGNQLQSSIVFFIQTSLWVFFVVPIVYFFPAYRSLDFVYLSWLAGAGISILVAWWFLWANKIILSFDGMGAEWIRSGLKKSAIFLLSSIMLKLLLTIDRYAMEYYSTPEVVGVYVFYVSITMGVFNFLEPAVFSFIYPKLLQFHQDSNRTAFAETHKELIYSTVVGVVLLSLGLSYLVPAVINVLDLQSYAHNLDSLWLVILASALYMLGFIPHYILYSRGEFHWLSYANAAALLAFFIAVYLLSIHSTISLVASSLAVAFTVAGAVKVYAAYIRHPGREHDV